MRYLNKICETNGGKIQEQDVPLTKDSAQVWQKQKVKTPILTKKVHDVLHNNFECHL